MLMIREHGLENGFHANQSACQQLMLQIIILKVYDWFFIPLPLYFKESVKYACTLRV